MGTEIGSTQGAAGADATIAPKKKVLTNFERRARSLVTKTLLPKSRKSEGVKEKMFGLHRDISNLCNNLYKKDTRSLRYKAKISKRESIESALGRLGKFFAEEVKIGMGDLESSEGYKIQSALDYCKDQMKELPGKIDYVEDQELPTEPAMAGGKAQENPNGKISIEK